MAKQYDRFVRIFKQGVLEETSIWVDRITGVNYLWHSSGYGGGLTVLLDRDGKPIVSTLPITEE